MNPYLNLHPTSPFGERTNPISGFHPGCDYRPVDKKTYAGISGIVTRAERGSHGEVFFVQVQGKIKDTIFYANSYHNENNFVQKGESVSFDTVVAESGATGITTGIHIHHEIRSYNLSSPFIKKLMGLIPSHIEGNHVFLTLINFINISIVK